MHPEMSLIMLTVMSGLGQGMIIVLFVLKFLYGYLLPVYVTFLILLISLILQTVGTISSLKHLGHPLRVWKAIKKVGHSWLSREVLSGGIAFGGTVLYMIILFVPAFRGYEFAIALFTVMGSVSFLISSSMLYTTIKYVKEWANLSTPIMFFLMGVTGGLGVVYTVLWYVYPLSNELLYPMGLVLIFFGIVLSLLKLLTYSMLNRLYEPIDLNKALGVKGGIDIRQTDMGTPYEHFNTKEFSYPMPEEEIDNNKVLIVVFGFVVPMVLWFIMLFLSTYKESTYTLGFVLGLVGIAMMLYGYINDRKLFFIQGNHIQSLYYNRYKYASKGTNPLLVKAKGDSPYWGRKRG